MRTSAPSALTSNKLFEDPGTRSMSPKEQKIASSRSATATALSISSTGVTQTGQPRAVDQRDLMGQQVFQAALDDGVGLAAADFHDRPRASYFLRIACASCSAAFLSRYSLRNFTELPFPSSA